MKCRSIARLILMLAACAVVDARAEVRSLTLGIDVNSPYGLAECWVLVREGLMRLEGVEPVEQRPAVKTATCEVHTRDGKLLDLQLLSQHILDLRIGARLRGVEATIDGSLMEEKGKLVLHVSGTNEVLFVVPLKHMVQMDWDNKREQVATRRERRAYKGLLAEWRGEPRRVRIVGLLVKDGDAHRPMLEVRQFKLEP